MKMKFDSTFRSSLWATALCCLAALFCSSPLHTHGGSGTEAPNALIVVSESGRLYGVSQKQCSAGAFDSVYAPYNDSGFDTSVQSDTFNRFDFGLIGQGTYNVVVTDDSGKAAYISGIRVEPGIGPDTFRSGLKPTGSVSGYVRDSSGRAYPMLPVYFPGSPFFDRTDTNGFFAIEQVPAGDFHVLTKKIIFVPQGQQDKDTLMADTVCSLSGGESKSMGVLMLKE